MHQTCLLSPCCTVHLYVTQVGLGDHWCQCWMILPPQLQCRLHIAILSCELLLKDDDNVGEVLVHDGCVGSCVRPGYQQLTFPHLRTLLYRTSNWPQNKLLGCPKIKESIQVDKVPTLTPPKTTFALYDWLLHDMLCCDWLYQTRGINPCLSLSTCILSLPKMFVEISWNIGHWIGTPSSFYCLVYTKHRISVSSE